MDKQYTDLFSTTWSLHFLTYCKRRATGQPLTGHPGGGEGRSDPVQLWFQGLHTMLIHQCTAPYVCVWITPYQNLCQSCLDSSASQFTRGCPLERRMLLTQTLSQTSSQHWLLAWTKQYVQRTDSPQTSNDPHCFRGLQLNLCQGLTPLLIGISFPAYRWYFLCNRWQGRDVLHSADSLFYCSGILEACWPNPMM